MKILSSKRSEDLRNKNTRGKGKLVDCLHLLELFSRVKKLTHMFLNVNQYVIVEKLRKELILLSSIIFLISKTES